MKMYVKGMESLDYMEGFQHDFTPEPVKDWNDQILSKVFAPDPVTGNPASDAFMLLNTKNPALQDYIVNNLRTPVPDNSHGVEDPDDALTLSKDVFESRNEYFERLRDFVREDFKKLQKDDT